MIDGNPFVNVRYEEGGETIPRVLRVREQYMARITNTDGNDLRLGAATVT